MNTQQVSQSQKDGILSITSAAKPLDRHAVDHAAATFKENWMNLARRTQLLAPMFHHPVSKALMQRENDVTTMATPTPDAPAYPSLVASASFDEARSRFKNYQDAHFAIQIERWQSEQLAAGHLEIIEDEKEMTRRRPTMQ